MLKQVKDDQERAEAAYEAVSDGTRSLRTTYASKFAAICDQVKKLGEERINDKDRIFRLQSVVEQQKAERIQMAALKNDMEKQRARHVREISALIEGFEERLTENEKLAESKVNDTLLLVHEMRKTHMDFTSQNGIFLDEPVVEPAVEPVAEPVAEPAVKE